jgi:hypothetical protein
MDNLEQSTMVERKLSVVGSLSQSVPYSNGGLSAVQLARIINSSPRPYVLINERELSVLRRGLTKDGWKRALYLQPSDLYHGIYKGSGILSKANQWLDKEIIIPSKPGGATDVFICECGVQLESEDFEVKAEYICPACSKKNSSTEYDAAVLGLQHLRLAGSAMALALAYSIEKDRAFSDKAANILLAYAQFCREMHKADSAYMIFTNPIYQCVWVIAMAQVYDLIYYSRSLSEEDRALIETNLFQPVAAYFLQNQNLPEEEVWAFSAVGIIGLSIKDSHLAASALESYSQWVNNYINKDGLCRGFTLTQHFSAAAVLVHFSEAFYRCGINLFIAGPLKAMFTAPINLMYPSFRLPVIGDENFDSFLPLDLYEVAYRRWGNSEFAWVLKKGYRFSESPLSNYQRLHPEKFSRSGFYAFLFGRDLPGRSASPMFKSSDFPSMGICTLRSAGNLMATLNYHTADNIRHADRLAFTLYTGEDIVAPDYGLSGSGKMLSRWAKSTAAHNTVMVDDRPQLASGESGLFYQCAGMFLQGIECRASGCYPGVSHSRRILMIDEICIIHDQLASDSEHDFDWLMRSKVEMNVHGDYTHCEIEPAKDPLLTWESGYEIDNSCRINFGLSAGILVMTMWPTEGKAVLALGRCASNSIEQKIPIMGCRQHGKKAGFLAVMIPAEKTDHVNVTRDGSIITIDTVENRDILYMKECGEPIKPILETDGDFAAVRTSFGEIKSVVISNGSFVNWNGDPVLESSSKVGCLEIDFDERGPQVKYKGSEVGMVKVRTNARALRVNGFRAPAYNTDGYATLRITGHMVDDQLIPDKN